MSWIFYALTAPFLYGTSNFIDKFLIEKRIRNLFFITFLGGFITLFFGLIIFSLRNFPILDFEPALILALSGFFAEIGLLPYYKAAAVDDISRISPQFQLIPVVVLAASYFLLGERLTQAQLIGFVLVLIGGLSLAIEKPALTKEIFKIRKSFPYVVLATLFFSFSAVLFKFVVININFLDSLAYEFLGAGFGALILLSYLKSAFLMEIKKISLNTWSLMGANELIYLVGRFAWFYAIALGPVSLVSVLGSIQPFIVFAIGLILSIWFPRVIKENIEKQVIGLKIISIIFIFIGILFINH